MCQPRLIGLPTFHWITAKAKVRQMDQNTPRRTGNHSTPNTPMAHFQFPAPDTVVKLDKNDRKPIFLPPNSSPDGTYHERPMLQYEDELPASSAPPVAPVKRMASRRNDRAMRFLSDDEVFPLPNVRRRRQNENEQARRLSQSTFNRISQTLGALNTMGNFFLNITREVNGDPGHQSHRGDMQLVSSSATSTSVAASSTTTTTTTKKAPATPTTAPTTRSPASASHSPTSTTEHSPTTKTPTRQGKPDPLPAITKTGLGPNATKTIEPLIKRVGNDYSAVDKNTLADKQTLSEKIDMAALAEKKRKKHQATTFKKETTLASFATTIAPGWLGFLRWFSLTFG